MFSYDEPTAPPRRRRSQSSTRSSNCPNDSREERFSSFPNRLRRNFSTEFVPVMVPFDGQNPTQQYYPNQMHPNYGEPMGQQQMLLNNMPSNQTQVLVPNYSQRSSRSPVRQTHPKWMQNQMQPQQQIIRGPESLYPPLNYVTSNQTQVLVPNYESQRLSRSPNKQTYPKQIIGSDLNTRQLHSPQMRQQNHMISNMKPERPPPPNPMNVYNRRSPSPMSRRSVSPMATRNAIMMPINVTVIPNSTIENCPNYMSSNLMPNAMYESRPQMQTPSLMPVNIRRSASLVTSTNLRPSIRRSPSPGPTIQTANFVQNPNAFTPINQRSSSPINVLRHSSSPKTNMLNIPQIDKSFGSFNTNKTINKPLNQTSINSRKGSLYGKPSNNETFGDHFDQYRTTNQFINNNKTNRFSDDFTEDFNFDSNSISNSERSSKTLPKPVDNILPKDNILDNPTLETPTRKISTGQRKASLPSDYINTAQNTDDWSREKVSSLSHEARIKSHQKTPNINATKVGIWFSRQLLIILVSSINLLLAYLFYQLFQMLPNSPEDQ